MHVENFTALPVRSPLGLLGVLAALAVGCSGNADEPRAVGTLERDRVELVAEAQEPILERAVREGDLVEAGDLIVRLEDVRFQAQLAEAEARQASAVSTLTDARLEHERVEALFKRGVASRARLDTVRARHEEAIAAVSQAKAAIAELQVRLERLTVHAPRSGRIDALPFQVGERPPPGAAVAVMLVDGAPYARVFVPEPIRVRVRPGLAARVFVDGVERVYQGRVRSVESEASFTPYFALTERDRSRLSYVAKVDLVEPEAEALPTGVPVEVLFDLGDGGSP